MQISRMRQLADLSLSELRQVLIRDIRKIPTARVKRRLRQYLYCRRLIDCNVEHLQQLRSQAQRITAAYKAVPGGGGSGSGRVEIAAQILQLEAIIKADTKRLQEELLEQKHHQEEQTRLITALASDYWSVYYVDLDHDAGVCYQAHSDVDGGLRVIFGLN